MSTLTRLFALSLLALSVSAGAAEAAKKKRRPYLRNCSSAKRVLVCVYNGDDSAGSAAASSKALQQGDRMRINCNGNGKKGCRVKVISSERDGGFGCMKGKKGNFIGMNTSHHIISVDGDGLASFRRESKDQKCR